MSSLTLFLLLLSQGAGFVLPLFPYRPPPLHHAEQGTLRRWLLPTVRAHLAGVPHSAPATLAADRPAEYVQAAGHAGTALASELSFLHRSTQAGL